MLAGGGRLLSTVSDELRVAQLLLNGGQLAGRRVLKRETVALMMKDQLPHGLTPIPGPAADWPPGNNGFGYGGAVRVDSDKTVPGAVVSGDRKSTRLNSSHEWISYAVFCLKKKKKNKQI